MTDALVERHIEQRLQNNWGLTTIDINPNVPFPDVHPHDSYIKLDILVEGEVQRLNIGTVAPVYRHRGTIVVRIYTVLDTGSRLGKSYGDLVAAIYNDQTFNGIVCRQARVTSVGEFEGRWQTNVLVPFKYDEFV